MLERIDDALTEADAFHISVSFVRCTGVGLLLDPLKRFLRRGGSGRLLTSDYLGITQPEALEVLMGMDNLECRVQSSARGFHPKLYTFQGGDQVWVGSSNLSKGGLTDNLEANLLSRDPAVLRQAITGFEALWGRPDVFAPTAAWLEDYARRRATQPPLLAHDPGAWGDTPKPNGAQREALVRLQSLREQGERRAVVVAAPGVGKTYLAAFDAGAMGARTVLFVSHRLEHLTQAKRTFESVYGDIATAGLVGAGRFEVEADMVFCSIQSLSSPRGRALLQRRFDYMVVDEFHHASAPSYRRALEAAAPRFLLGLTATPERQDGHDVLTLCDYNIAYEVRLLEAIERGWLLPFHYFGVADETVAWGDIPWRNNQFDPGALENALMLEARADVILQAARERGFDGPRRATVGFCAGVRHARFMADAFRHRGLEAIALTGDDALEHRAEGLRRLADPHDPLEWLFVADLLNEGVDVPAINSLLFLRPTQSPTIFLQQLGRGLRLSPGCEVLTAIDFVGHHRDAWTALGVLDDRRRAANAATRKGVTPPSGCEIVLDDLTVSILDKVQRFTGKKRERCLEAYRWLRDALEAPPMPIDLWGREDTPPFSDFRSAFGSWSALRRQTGDADPWERSLSEDHPLEQLLRICERDHQQQRVYAYALLLALVTHREDPERGYRAFFDRFPRWRAEYKALAETGAWSTLSKKLGALLQGEALAPEVFASTSAEALAEQVLGRLRLTLERDYRTRHAGVLRAPEQLRLHHRYARNEIVNHFGEQYDPARHNKGLLLFGDQADQVALLTKLDTRSARTEHQYINRFLDAGSFAWQSQNRQRRDNEAGRRITEHVERGITLHLFVQRRAASDAVYVGTVQVAAVRGDAPMNVTLALTRPLSAGAAEALGITLEAL